MIKYYWVAARFDGETAVQMAKKNCQLPPIFFSLVHLEPELELFEVWVMMVRQISITNISDVIIYHIYNIVDRFLFLASNNFATFCHSLLINIKSKE